MQFLDIKQQNKVLTAEPSGLIFLMIFFKKNLI